jgi:hypothetical protein
MIYKVLDSLIPGDNELDMPSASMIDFDTYIVRYGIEENVEEFLSELQKISFELFIKDFDKLNHNQKNTVIKEIKFKKIRLFTNFIKHVFRAYYSDKRVLSKLNVGTSPPFPDGNIVQDDDWSILSTVYDRGPIHRLFDKE